MKSAVMMICAAAILLASESYSVQPAGLTVHEWGTFTSVAGEDGSAIDWNTLGCTSDLPGFVNDFGYRGFKFRLQGTVRMETPVLYFYSSREMEARVKVAFPKGLITEWYPKADYQVYQAGMDGTAQLASNLNGIDTSLRDVTGTIEWKKIQVQPGASPALPKENAPNRYYEARATDAAPVTVGKDHEKFLFYRGVGRFAVPLKARVSQDGKVMVENQGPAPVPGVVLFENRGGRIGYRVAGTVRDSVTLDSPVLDGSLAGLRVELEKTLVAQGLFPKEASAMLETWRDSWFEEGSRLIYLVPTAGVDALLPIEVEPAPAQKVRVFVGRIELITPEVQRTVAVAAARNDLAAVRVFQRFLSPILQRASGGSVQKAIEARRLESELGCR